MDIPGAGKRPCDAKFGWKYFPTPPLRIADFHVSLMLLHGVYVLSVEDHFFIKSSVLSARAQCNQKTRSECMASVIGSLLLCL